VQEIRVYHSATTIDALLERSNLINFEEVSPYAVARPFDPSSDPAQSSWP
jgi:hypothetical protein